MKAKIALRLLSCKRMNSLEIRYLKMRNSIVTDDPIMASFQSVMNCWHYQIRCMEFIQMID